MPAKLPLCKTSNCQRVANHTGDHSDEVEYREIKHHPFYKVQLNFEQKVSEGALCFQQWTCDACGAKQTMDQANGWYLEGGCENCGWATDLRLKGCNFLLLQGVNAKREDMRAIITALGLRPPRDN